MPALQGASCHGAPRHALTVLGDQLFAAELPRGRLGASGVAIALGANAFPGVAIDRAKPLPWSRDNALLVAPKQAHAVAVFDVLAAAERSQLHVDLALDCGGGVPGFVPPGLQTEGPYVAEHAIEVDDAMTFQDLATAMAKRVGMTQVKLVRKP